MINISDKYAISFGELSVDIYERRINKTTGKEYVKPKYYYGNLEQALEGLIDRSLVGDMTELKAVVEMINDLKLEIREFCRSLPKSGLLTGDSQEDLK
jgi:hypothetical protein